MTYQCSGTVILLSGPYYTPNFGYVNVLQDDMLKIIEKAKIKAKKLIGIATWVLVLFLIISTVKNIGRVGSINSAVQKEKEKIEKMKEENVRLEAEIAQTQGSEFIEKQIRDRLGFAKEGEAIVILPDAETLRKLAPQILIEKDTLPDPNWRRWMKLFTI
jgi:cell division protein FtsB